MSDFETIIVKCDGCKDEEECRELPLCILDAYNKGRADERKKIQKIAYEDIKNIRADAIEEALQSYIHWVESEDRANVSFEEVLLRLKEQKNEL